ncbi:sulfurtransferase [Aeromicrobium wangtongii]|uniref:Rhodanese-like domain-containing protein n=1 Tax=Aeromicrobium wangtongii TaxID=2969247 RepID=A0ABY5M706_9ACTN|nr:rhodanese-like domain-containing protein [Aeromicrobium wangtongii]MCD9199120.1 hypothetical protein [Aeromicrobium wangtongii]UUP12849.1 rhodanese-like domain-containing protein [Aeromicrobium wangtongii]
MTDSEPPLVSTAWLATHLEHPTLRILDATVDLTHPGDPGTSWAVASGAAEHAAEHIPGALHADLLSQFSAPTGIFQRPDADQVTAALAELGIGSFSRIVIYDRAATVWAARLWWVLRSFGIEASVLDGGLTAWQAEGRPTTSEPTPVTPCRPPAVTDRSELFADCEEVLSVVRDGGACLVNTLSTSEFTASEPTFFARGGRIPGSLNVPSFTLLAGDNTFLPVQALRKRFADVLTGPDRKILYCGIGVAACVDALALTLLGETDVAVYDASYEEWAADLSLPVEVHA